jgi:hypothetical protein
MVELVKLHGSLVYLRSAFAQCDVVASVWACRAFPPTIVLLFLSFFLVPFISFRILILQKILLFCYYVRMLPYNLLW